MTQKGIGLLAHFSFHLNYDPNCENYVKFWVETLKKEMSKDFENNLYFLFSLGTYVNQASLSEQKTNTI